MYVKRWKNWSKVTQNRKKTPITKMFWWLSKRCFMQTLQSRGLMFVSSEMSATLKWLQTATQLVCHVSTPHLETSEQEWFDRWGQSSIFRDTLHWSWQPMDVQLHLWDNQSYVPTWVTKGGQWALKSRASIKSRGALWVNEFSGD